MPKFSLEKIVDTKRDLIFDVLADFNNYQKLLPEHYPSVRVRSTRDGMAVAEEHINLGGIELVIMAKHITKRPILHEVFVIGGDAKGSHFKQEFVEIANNTTKIMVTVDLKLKGKMKLYHIFAQDKFETSYEQIINDLIKTVKD